MPTPTDSKTSKANRTVFTVSRLNQDVNGLLESEFGMLWVEGELSNFSRPGSGHFYFSLKDSRSQIRCAMFRGRNRYINFKPEDGQQVLLRGKLGVYEARGDFQFIAEHIELAGSGALQQKFEETKQRLNAEGLFSQENKKELPAWPNTIGVITSPTGAAIKDVLNVLSRRYPRGSVIIYPTMVQGANSAANIVQAINRATHRREVDVLILTRGGGSIEDLWGFNEESVANAVHQCPIPVICGVGHEIDFTIADLVADKRAPTPSAAAELSVPDTQDALAQIQGLKAVIKRALMHRLAPTATLIHQLINRLHSRHPERVVAQQFQRTDELEARLTRAVQTAQYRYRANYTDLASRLTLHSPSQQIERRSAQLQTLQLKLKNQIATSLDSHKAKLATSARALDTVSPLATLSRGYSVVRKEGHIIKSHRQLKSGDRIEALLGEGQIVAEVTESSGPTSVQK